MGKSTLHQFSLPFHATLGVTTSGEFEVAHEASSGALHKTIKIAGQIQDLLEMLSAALYPELMFYEPWRSIDDDTTSH